MPQPKHAYYLFKPTGEVMPALRTPEGYEDAHPEDFEPAEAPVAQAPQEPVAVVPLAPTIPEIPPFAPPVTGPGNPDTSPLEDTELE